MDISELSQSVVERGGSGGGGGVVFSFDKPVCAILLLVPHFKVASFLKTPGRS